MLVVMARALARAYSAGTRSLTAFEGGNHAMKPCNFPLRSGVDDGTKGRRWRAQCVERDSLNTRKQCILGFQLHVIWRFRIPQTVATHRDKLGSLNGGARQDYVGFPETQVPISRVPALDA